MAAPDPLTLDEDFYIERKTSGRPLGPSMMDDLEYFRAQLFRALGIPSSYFRETKLVAIHHDEHIYEVRYVPECERGPGIAALDLTPKRDNAVWMLDEDLLCDDAD